MADGYLARYAGFVDSSYERVVDLFMCPSDRLHLIQDIRT